VLGGPPARRRVADTAADIFKRRSFGYRCRNGEQRDDDRHTRAAIYRRRTYDYALFILSPLIAMALGLALFSDPAFNPEVRLQWWDPRVRPEFAMPFLLFFISVFTHAHLVIVFFRSHGNESIFTLHPIRFRIAPVALLVAMLTWQWAFIAVGVLVVWWDIYHSALQTFGLARIYDVRNGNDPQAGRRLDYLLNLLIYIGPIFAGLNLVMHEHVKHFGQFARVDAPFVATLGDRLLTRQPEIRWLVFGTAAVILAAYFREFRRLAREEGYRVPRPKLWLLLSTATCSVVSWGLLSVGEAFFIMNFFHALQYFAIVWWSERKTLVRLFGLERLEVSTRGAVALVLLVVPAFAYGVWSTVKPGFGIVVVAVSHVVSIMHFWYDGFIWSVRKRQV